MLPVVCVDRHVCVCPLRVRMSRRHAPLPTPSARILFSLWRKSGQAGRKSSGGPSHGGRAGECRRAPGHTPAPPGRCHPCSAHCPDTTAPSTLWLHPHALHARRCGDTIGGRGTWEMTQTGESPKSFATVIWTFLNPTLHKANLFPAPRGHNNDKCWGRNRRNLIAV